MRKKLLKIVNHYGIRKQTKYLMSEIYELVEAIVEKEESKKDAIKNMCDILRRAFSTEYKDIYKDHIAEEISDCYVLIEQIRNYYNISISDLKEIMTLKIDRQLMRINAEESGKMLDEITRYAKEHGSNENGNN